MHIEKPEDFLKELLKEKLPEIITKPRILADLIKNDKLDFLESLKDMSYSGI